MFAKWSRRTSEMWTGAYHFWCQGLRHLLVSFLHFCCSCVVSRGQRLLRLDIKSKVKSASFCRLLLTHVKRYCLIQLQIPFFSLSYAIPFWFFSLSLRVLDLDHDRATLGWDDTLSRSQSTLSAIVQLKGTTNNLMTSLFYSLFFLFLNALQFRLHFLSSYTSPTYTFSKSTIWCCWEACSLPSLVWFPQVSCVQLLILMLPNYVNPCFPL